MWRLFLFAGGGKLSDMIRILTCYRRIFIVITTITDISIFFVCVLWFLLWYLSTSENIKKVKSAILKVLYLLLIRYQIEKTASWEIFLFIRIHSSFANIKNILNFKRELKISLWEMFGQILTMFGKYKPIYSLSYLKRKGISHLARSQ